jgi:ABC transporter substrate binding protein
LFSGPASLAARSVTGTIPIVFVSGFDPVTFGIVASLNRPGGNVTGVTFVAAELGAKQLGLLHELQPEAVGVGVLVDPNYAPTQSLVSDVQTAASSIGKQIEVFEAPTGRDIDTVFANLAQKPIDGQRPVSPRNSGSTRFVVRHFFDDLFPRGAETSFRRRRLGIGCFPGFSSDCLSRRSPTSK